MANPTTSFDGSMNPDEEGTHLRDYFKIVLRRWKIALAVFLVVFLGAAASNFYTKPIYQATVTLEVKVRAQGGMLKDIGVSAENSVLATEMEILRSRSLGEAVAKDLNLIWEPSEKTGNFGGHLRRFGVDSNLETLTIELTGGKSFRVLDGDAQVIGTGESGEPFSADGVSLVLDIYDGRSGERLQLIRRSLSEASGKIMGNVQIVEVGKGTNILRLSYQDANPVRARDIVNALAAVYQRQSVSSNTQEAAKTVEFINQQLAGLKGKLDQTEQDLQEYKVHSGLVTLGPEGGTLVGKLVSLEQKRNELGLRRKRFELAIDEAKRALTGGIKDYSPAAIDGVPLTADIAGRLADLNGQKKALLNDFTEVHPAVVNIQQQIKRSLEALLSAYQSSYQGVLLEQRDLEQTIAGYDRQLQGIPGAELELAKRTRVNKVNSDLYNFLLQKQQEARIAEASTLSQVNIIDSAIIPTSPINSNSRKTLTLGLMLGLLLGLGLVFFLEYLDDSINDGEAVKRELGLTVLGTIPRISEEDISDHGPLLINFLAPKSPPVEAFRALRTGITFATARDARKLILITSSLPNEGKTTLAANLAMVIAQTSARVLLVGCDLRRPGLYDMFGTSNIPGLSDLLIGDAKDYLHHIPGTTLDLISAGTIPPHPAELLGSERMKQFLAYSRERYDYVLLDAPPVLPVTDAQILATMVDDVLVVMEPCRVPRKAAQRMVDNLRAVDAKIIGVALNDKLGKGFKYYGNYSYYGHKYYGGYYGETKVVEDEGVMAKLKKFLG